MAWLSNVDSSVNVFELPLEISKAKNIRPMPKNHEVLQLSLDMWSASRACHVGAKNQFQGSHVLDEQNVAVKVEMNRAYPGNTCERSFEVAQNHVSSFAVDREECDRRGRSFDLRDDVQVHKYTCVHIT